MLVLVSPQGGGKFALMLAPRPPSDALAHVRSANRPDVLLAAPRRARLGRIVRATRRLSCRAIESRLACNKLVPTARPVGRVARAGLRALKGASARARFQRSAGTCRPNAPAPDARHLAPFATRRLVGRHGRLGARPLAQTHSLMYQLTQHVCQVQAPPLGRRNDLLWPRGAQPVGQAARRALNTKHAMALPRADL